MFVGRHEELAFLNRLLTRKQPGLGQMVLLYGRRRVGNTAFMERLNLSIRQHVSALGS